MPESTPDRIGRLAADRGLVTEAQLTQALAEQERRNAADRRRRGAKREAIERAASQTPQPQKEAA